MLLAGFNWLPIMCDACDGFFWNILNSLASVVELLLLLLLFACRLLPRCWLTSDAGELGGDSLISGVCDGVAYEFDCASKVNFRPELELFMLSSGVLWIVDKKEANKKNHEHHTTAY